VSFLTFRVSDNDVLAEMKRNEKIIAKFVVEKYKPKTIVNSETYIYWSI